MATEIVADAARELERIRGEVVLAKEELRVRFEHYFQMLRDKHLELVAQLDEVVRVAETQVEDRQVKLNQLIITKAEVSHILQHNELSETRISVTRDLDEKIRGLEVTVDRIPSVWLEWCDGCLESGMAGLCRLCEGVSYANRHNPVWSGVNKGIGEMEMLSPFGLSIDKDNGDIFLCDVANGIQVFSKEGDYSRTIKFQGMIYSSFITVSLHHLFVICDLKANIYKLDKVSGYILCFFKTDYFMRGLSFDTDTLYAGMHGCNHISHISLENLKFVAVTPLNSPHITKETKLFDLKLTSSLFIVLFLGCTYPVQSFSRGGDLVRLIVSQEQLVEAYYFCLDRNMNIIISDIGAHNVKVFNGEGQLVATIGHEGTGPGEFYRPIGIDINKEGRIVVVDNKDSHKLQFF